MTRELFALLMAGILMIPLITSAEGEDRTVGVGAARPNPSHEPAWKGLSLPAVPHIDTMPRLNSDAGKQRMKVDTLFGPKLDTLGPFLLQPTLPQSQVSRFEPSAFRVTTE